MASRDGRASWLDRAAVALLAAATIVVLLTFRDYGLGWDDFTHSQYADLLLSFYQSGFKDKAAFSFVNLYYYGGGFDMAAALLAKILPFDLFETRRLLGGLVGVAGLVVVWRTARWLGGPLAGLIAAALLAACPDYVGHAFVNPKDGPFAVAMALMLFGLVRILREYPQPSGRSLTLFGFGLGIAFGTRIMAGLAGPGAVMALVLLVAMDWRESGAALAVRHLSRFLLRLIPALVLAYACMALLWPWSILDPLNPLRAVEYFSHFFEKPWRELFNGQLIRVPDMPRSYLPVMLGAKLPVIFLALGACGVVGALIVSLRRGLAPQERAAILMLTLAVLFPLVYTIITRPAMYNGIRHFVFVTPPLAVLAGLAGAYLLGRLERGSRPLAYGAIAIIVLGLVLPLREMIRLHPYEYTHYNAMVGGIRGADRRFMLDFWGLSFKQAAQQFHELLSARHEAKPSDRRWKIAVCGPHPPAHVALGPDFDLTWDPAGADFAMTLSEYYCLDLPAPVLVNITREGVSFAKIYDLRGRSISRILTIPPP